MRLFHPLADLFLPTEVSCCIFMIHKTAPRLDCGRLMFKTISHSQEQHFTHLLFSSVPPTNRKCLPLFMFFLLMTARHLVVVFRLARDSFYSPASGLLD